MIDRHMTHRMTDAIDRYRGNAELSGWTKSGLIFSSGLGLGDLPTVLYDAPEGHSSPPTAVLVLATLCGAATLAAALLAYVMRWKVCVHIVAGSRVISVLLGIPSILSATVDDQVRSFAIFSVPMGLLAAFLLYRTELSVRVKVRSAAFMNPP